MSDDDEDSSERRIISCDNWEVEKLRQIQEEEGNLLGYSFASEENEDTLIQEDEMDDTSHNYKVIGNSNRIIHPSVMSTSLSEDQTEVGFSDIFANA